MNKKIIALLSLIVTMFLIGINNAGAAFSDQINDYASGSLAESVAYAGGPLGYIVIGIWWAAIFGIIISIFWMILHKAKGGK